MSPTSRRFTRCLPRMASSLAVVGRIYDQLVGGDIRTGGPAPERSGRLLGDCPGRPHLHLPSQPGREVARRHGRHRRRRPVLLRLPRQQGGRLRLHPELPRCGRVVASDRRAHLRGRRPGAALHLPLRPRHLDHSQAHLGERPGRRLANRWWRDRSGSVAGGRLRRLEIPGVAAGREHHADPQ